MIWVLSLYWVSFDLRFIILMFGKQAIAFQLGHYCSLLLPLPIYQGSGTLLAVRAKQVSFHSLNFRIFIHGGPSETFVCFTEGKFQDSVRKQYNT